MSKSAQLEVSSRTSFAHHGVHGERCPADTPSPSRNLLQIKESRDYALIDLKNPSDVNGGLLHRDT
jgi:hypothetical protein